MSDDKYKMFRNYMANELGITKEDIKQWTIEAVEASVQRQIGQIDVEGIISSTLKREQYRITSNASKDLVKELADRLQAKLTWKQED